MAELFPLTSRQRGEDGKRQSVHVIACSRCPAEDLVSAQNTRMSEGHLSGTFQKRGWRVSASGKHVCPTCVEAEAKARRDARKPEPAAMKTPVVPSAAAEPPSAAASSAIVSLYVLLEDGYDRAAKAYKPGWSDDRLAKETGLALDVVRRRREADFGPLVEDTTLADLRKEWALLQGDLDVLAEHQSAAAARLRAVAEREARLAKLLDAVAAKAGLGAVSVLPARAA